MKSGSFRQLAQQAERARAARSRSWSNLELESVPLPSELTSQQSHCATEASLAEQFETEPSQTATCEGQRRRLLVGGKLRGYMQSHDQDLAEGSASRRCEQVLKGGAARWSHLPVREWGRNYSRQLLRADLMAGLTVGVVLIPQGVAYAMLAELPPIYGMRLCPPVTEKSYCPLPAPCAMFTGLYCSLIPLPVYALMCSSFHMSIGPFALVSLLVADTVSKVVDPQQEEEYVRAVMLLSLMIGQMRTAKMLACGWRVWMRVVGWCVGKEVLRRSAWGSEK